MTKIDKEILKKVFKFMATAKTLADKYEANKEITAKYKIIFKGNIESVPSGE